MVMIRLHGGAPRDPDQTMVIDWNYLLLTSNAINYDKQATTYGYIVKAMHLLNNAHFEVDDGVGGKVKVIVKNPTVFNAGINKIAAWNMRWKTDTQRVENRAAYIHAIDTFAEANL